MITNADLKQGFADRSRRDLKRSLMRLETALEHEDSQQIRTSGADVIVKIQAFLRLEQTVNK